MGDADQISDYLSCSYNEIQSTTMKEKYGFTLIIHTLRPVPCA